MERLTFDGNFCDIAQCQEVPGGSICENGSCSQRKVWERLKAYEDTGLTPDEVKAMAYTAPKYKPHDRIWVVLRGNDDKPLGVECFYFWDSNYKRVTLYKTSPGKMNRYAFAKECDCYASEQEAMDAMLKDTQA